MLMDNWGAGWGDGYTETPAFPVALGAFAFIAAPVDS